MILLFFWGIACTISAQSFENYDIDNSGLPNNKITSITIVDNAIWITTENGMAAFDGNVWQAFSTDDELSSNFIFSSMLVPTQEKLWIGSNAGIDNFSINELSITSEISSFNTSNSGIIADNILSLNWDFESNSWAGTDQGISFIKTDTIINLQSGVPGINLYVNYINSLAISKDTVTHNTNTNYVPSGGVMYAATNGGGVGRFYNHEVDGITSASVVEKNWSGLPSDTVLAVFVDDNNNHWYGTPAGAASHYGHNSKYAIWKKYKIQDGLVNNRVTAITSDNFGNIWFGTVGGISRFDGENWISFTEADGLISDSVNDIKVDLQDNIWIATDKGLSKLFNIVSVKNEENFNTNLFQLKLDAYPNPFNMEVNLKITLNENSNIRIQIFNMLGELIKSFSNTYYSVGEHNISWNALNENNQVVNSGIYIIQAMTNNNVINKKIILLK
jgi:ligand-binding sensor domain-containing protein